MSKTEPLIFLTLENVALHTTFTIPINSKSIPLAALVKSMMLPLLHFSSVAQSCPTLCEPMDCNTPDLPVHHQLPGFTQTHVHWVGDVIQPSHHLSTLILLPSIFPSIRVFPISHFFTSGVQSIDISASLSVLPKNILDLFPLGLTGWISLQSKGLSRVFSNTTVQKHQFFSA